MRYAFPPPPLRITHCKIIENTIKLTQRTFFPLRICQQSELYGVTSDKRGQEYMTLSGSTMLCVTAYIALLQAGNSQAQAFAAAWGVNAVTALRFGLSTAKEMDIPTTGPLIWSALSAAIAGLALKA